MPKYPSTSQKTKYKGVYKIICGDKITFRMSVFAPADKNNSVNKQYPSDREAALAYDKYLISKGREPVNILKRKGNVSDKEIT